MFWKLRILIKLRKSAESGDTLFLCFPRNARLFKAIKFLKSRGYIVENIQDEYSLADYAALRQYIWDMFSVPMLITGFVGGIIAIIQSLAEYCMK